MKLVWRGILPVLMVSALSIPAQAVSLRDAVRSAVHSNPDVQAVMAARRASDYRLGQARGALRPQVNLSGDFGLQAVDRPSSLAATVNRKYRYRRQASMTISQVLFDGWRRANDIYENAARVDAAALRVVQQSEILGLNAVEAYIDVRRLTHLSGIARENARRHVTILELIRIRKSGGKSPASELDQTLERVAGAKAIVAEIKQRLLEARARFKRIVGKEPRRTSRVGFPSRLPHSRKAAVRLGLVTNPAIKAALADTDAAGFAREQAKGGYYPEISLQGTGTLGENIGGTAGRNNDISGRIVASWNIFDGLITTNRNREASERWYEAKARTDSQRRAVTESVERAWAAYSVGRTRVAELRKQAHLNRRVVKTYLEEYRLSKRSLLDLLDSESSLFNSRFQLSSIEAVRLFSAYQLLASMGVLLDRLGVPSPKEGTAQRRIETRRSLGVFNINIEPLRKR